MVSPAKRRSNNAWDRANMAVLGCKVRRDYADKIRAACAARGDTVNAVLKRALDDYMEEYRRGDWGAEDD